MRIVYVIGSLHPGGAEIQKVNHLLALKKSGHDVMCILPNGVGDYQSPLLGLLRSSHIPILDLEAHDCFDPETRIFFMTRFFGNIPNKKPDVIHASGYPTCLEAIIAGWQAQVPCRVLSWESMGFERERFDVQPYFEYIGTHFATDIVANSLAGTEVVKSFLGATPDRVVYIPNALMHIPDISADLRKSARDHFNFSDNMVVIGYLANFKEDGLKNQLLLIRAAARLRERFPNARYILAGYATSYFQKCKLEAKSLDVSDIVLFPGRIDNLNLLRGWDIGVNVSHTEGLSSSIQEQMVYGETPFVATRVGGNPELVVPELTGLLIEDDDLDGLVNALAKLIENPDLRIKMGKAARERIIELYDWNSVVYPQWMALYQQRLECQKEQS